MDQRRRSGGQAQPRSGGGAEGPALSAGAEGHRAVGHRPRVAVYEGKRRQLGQILPKLSPAGLKRKHVFKQGNEIVYLAWFLAVLDQPGLHVPFGALLGVEAEAVVIGRLASALLALHCHEVAFGLGHPVTRR